MAAVKAKYYPWILMFLFFLISGQVLPFVPGLLIGFLVLRAWADFCLKMPIERVRSMESNCLFRRLAFFDGFIKASDTAALEHPELPAPSSQPRPPTPNNPFGGRGVKVGTSDEESKGVSRLVQQHEADSSLEMLIPVPAEDLDSSEGKSRSTHIELADRKL